MIKREHWATRMGLVLAMAGNAIGFGNFLRFPTKAAQNGGGTFMIPYFIALILLGIPLMWVEWSLGRFGGVRGHGTSPGFFELIWKHRIAKYIGLIGVMIPLIVVVYYVYIESWTFAYTWYSMSGQLTTPGQSVDFQRMFSELTTVGGAADLWPVYFFFVMCVLINALVLWKGVAGGIEKLARIAMPFLFVFAIILVIKVLSLGTPDPTMPGRNVLNGMAFLWNPDFSKLTDMKVWLEAAGQVFFTLSVGFGVISCYASYLREKQDIALSGLTTCATNEIAEVVLGGSLLIPLAYTVFGPQEMMDIAAANPWQLAFVTMPEMFAGYIPMAHLASTLWFGLLLIAGITSSIALSQTVVAFLEDEFGWGRPVSVAIVWGFVFLVAHIIILGYPGSFDEADFWIGTLGVVLFAFLEIVLFVWVLGADKAWDEINSGAEIKIPRVVYYLIKYVSPIFLLGILITWVIQAGPSYLAMDGIEGSEVGWRWAARGMILATGVILVLMIRKARALKKLDEEIESSKAKSDL